MHLRVFDIVVWFTEVICHLSHSTQNSDNLLRFTKLVNVYLNLSIFTVFLKNRNFISKIRSSKVTDYAALTNSSDNTLFL